MRLLAKFLISNKAITIDYFDHSGARCPKRGAFGIDWHEVDNEVLNECTMQFQIFDIGFDGFVVEVLELVCDLAVFAN